MLSTEQKNYFYDTDSINSTKYQTVTLLLFMLNSLCFFFLINKGGIDTLFFPNNQVLIETGANFGLYTMTGQFWRIFSCLFLHAGLIHFVVNMSALLYVGSKAEKFFGKQEFLKIYFFSGICSSLASLIWSPLNISVGASGAMFGIYASILVALVSQKDRTMHLLHIPGLLGLAAFLTGSFTFGAIESGMDNSAHIGGFLAGFAITTIDLGLPQNWRFKILGNLVLLLFLCTITYMASLRFLAGDFNYYKKGIDLLSQEKYMDSIAYLDRFQIRNPNYADLYAYRGRAYRETGNIKKALENFTKAISLDPKKSAYYNTRAWTFAQLGDYNSALIDANHALKINTKFFEAMDTRGVALSGLGKFVSATADFTKAIEIAPNDPAAYYHLALIYEKLGQTKDARLNKSFALSLGYKPESWENFFTENNSH